jgi:hypothetical protein
MRHPDPVRRHLVAGAPMTTVVLMSNRAWTRWAKSRLQQRSLAQEVALRLGKGLIAGLAGTAAISLSQAIEMKLSHRPPSTTPADAAGKVLGVQPRSERDKGRFATLVHWAYGTAWGLVRAALDGGRRERMWAPLVHLAVVQGAAMVMLPSLDVAPPVRQWGAGVIGKEIVHHTVYAAAADATYRALS